MEQSFRVTERFIEQSGDDLAVGLVRFLLLTSVQVLVLATVSAAAEYVMAIENISELTEPKPAFFPYPNIVAASDGNGIQLWTGDGGNTWDEIVAQARAVEAAGATIINSEGMGRVLSHDIPIFAGLQTFL